MRQRQTCGNMSDDIVIILSMLHDIDGCTLSCPDSTCPLVILGLLGPYGGFMWELFHGDGIVFRSGRHQEALLELQALPPEVASMASLGTFESR